MKKIFILLLGVVLAMSSCSQNSTKPDDEKEDAKDNESIEQENAQESSAKSEDEADMEKLSEMIATAEQMTAFLNEGLEKANDYDLNMEMVDYKVCSSIMNFVYSNYTTNGDGYEYEDDNEEYKIYTITKVSKSGRAYNFNNTAYDYEQRENVSVVTDSTYYADKNLLVHIGTIAEPQSTSIDKYYLTDDGRLFIVGAQLYRDTLYTDVLYYDGSFIGIARKYTDNQSELKIPYDLEQMQPDSFEEMLTEEGYTTYFTYDGVNVENR